MPPEPRRLDNPRLRILSVGGNAVSAFLSWRLQATNACDITLVWKSGFESVAQYGISFKSSLFGNERFKPRQVVRTPEEAASSQRAPFDYVLLCIKALPDVYDIASVIQPVVTPQHTCILINTSNSLGVEALVEKRFPKNVVLSLVSNATINQLGPADFEHEGKTELWVGPANVNPEIPASIQGDMSEALAMTLSSGQIDCKVSRNIQQQQVERMAGPIVFHTTSVLFEEPDHSQLIEMPGVRELITEALEEMIQIAKARHCTFDSDFKERTITEMIAPKDTQSVMYQDFLARRPMEVETYLGSPLKLAAESNIKTPRISTLYALLRHENQLNLKRSEPRPADAGPPPPMHRAVSGGPPPMRGPGPGPGPNGHMGGPPMRGGRGGRTSSIVGPGPPPMMRRGPSNGYPPGPRGPMRDPNMDNNSLEDFSYLALYGEPSPERYDDGMNGYGDQSPNGEFGLRERELMLRQKELALREREFAMQHRGPPMSRSSRLPPPSQFGDDLDEEGEDYFDPMAYRGPPVDPDNIDMMSVTSRRTRKTPSMTQLRNNPEGQMAGIPRGRGGFGRPMMRNRTSSRMGDNANLAEMRANLMDNPLLGVSSDRYGPYDRSNMGRESRAGSLTTSRLNELQQNNGYGGYPPMSRRTSQSPGMGPPPPSPGYGPNGMMGRRPSPPDMRQPVPRHPPGRGNSVAPHEVEDRAGVSNLYPPKSGSQMRSLTGSASASAGSGDSGRSNHIDSENSAYSSQSSLGPRPPIGVR